MADIPESRIPELLRRGLQISADAARDAEHPDANLLAAYAEQSLSGAGRAGVVEHLSHCQQCREVFALSLPPLAEPVSFTPVVENIASRRGKGTRRNNWFTDENLLWARLVATVTVAIGIGITYYAAHDRQPELGPVPAITAPASRGANGETDGSIKSPSAGDKSRNEVAGDANKSASKDAAEQTPQSSREGSQAKLPAGTRVSPRRQAGKEAAASEESKKQVGQLPPAPPAAKARLAAAQTVEVGPGSALPRPVDALKDKEKLSPEVNKAATAERSSAAKTDRPRQETMRGGGAAKLGGQGGISAASGGMAPQSARPDRLPAVWEQQQATDSVTDLETQAVTDEQNQSAAQTQQSPTLKAVNPPANARYGAARAEIRGKINAGSASATHWTISPAGRLLRMTGGSPGPWMMSSKPETTPPAQWTEASVGRGVVFRAVAVVGANVWAGGSGKQFFYSRDDGIHWKRVTGRWQGDVTSIRFSDPRHGEMGTSAGERWVTVDGGEHWSEAGSAP